MPTFVEKARSLIPLLFSLVLLPGCAATSHEVAVAPLGSLSSLEAMEATLDVPGPVVVETVVAARWSTDLSGLINFDHPKVEAAGLEDELEPIEIYFYGLKHPEKGLYLVDSGIDDALAHDPGSSRLSWLLRKGMGLSRLEPETAMKAWLKTQKTAPEGVFLTHMHPDHVFGLPDIPNSAKVYVGPGEAAHKEFIHLLVQGSTDGLLDGKGPLLTWKTEKVVASGEGGIETVLDVFGDQSVFALHVPGHTPGSMAFVARTPDGAVLMTGDTCHTAWGWENGVEPGDFTDDHEGNAKSLAALKALAARHPKMVVKLGHQRLTQEP